MDDSYIEMSVKMFTRLFMHVYYMSPSRVIHTYVPFS